MPDPLLTGPGWLGRLLGLYLAAYDPARSEAAVAEALAAAPTGPRLEAALRLAERRLRGVGLRPDGPPLARALEERLAPHLAGAEPGLRRVVSTLAAQWDVCMDVARLHENLSGPEERALELLTVMALALRDTPLARRLRDAHLKAAARGRTPAPEYALGASVDVARLALAVEKRLAGRDKLRDARGALPVALGLTLLETRTLAALASDYFERATIEEEGVARLHELSAAQKVDLIEVLVALAWADGRLTGEEARLVRQQVELADLPKDDARRLLAHLDRPPALQELALRPTDPASRRFILEQAVLLTLVDDDLSAAEQQLLEEVARALGGSPSELEQVMVEVASFYQANRDAIRDFAPVSSGVGRLHELLMARAQEASKKNLIRLVQEIKETGELAKLLGAASVRQLTPEEASKVRAQLLDICKTIPALAIFAIPGGAILLPVLLKVLPFNLLPTAFSTDDPTAPRPGSPA